MPRLSSSEVQELAIKIHNGTESAQYAILNLLFNKELGYSAFDSFYDRLSSYLESSKPAVAIDRSALFELVINLLNYFKENDILSDADYDLEYNRSKSLLFPGNNVKNK